MSYPNVLVTPHGEVKSFERKEGEGGGKGDERRRVQGEKKCSLSLSVSLSLKKIIPTYPTKTVAFATTEALEEIARVVEKNIAAWWEWKRAGADPRVVLENEVVAPKS